MMFSSKNKSRSPTAIYAGGKPCRSHSIGFSGGPMSLRCNWLQVFKRVPTALLGSGGGPEHRTRLVPSEKCAVSWGSDDDEMRMITARFVRAIERFAGDLCWHFLPLFQQVVEIRKTRNQLYVK